MQGEQDVKVRAKDVATCPECSEEIEDGQERTIISGKEYHKVRVERESSFVMINFSFSCSGAIRRRSATKDPLFARSMLQLVPSVPSISKTDRSEQSFLERSITSGAMPR